MRFRIMFIGLLLLLCFYTVLCAVRLVPAHAIPAGAAGIIVMLTIARTQLLAMRQATRPATLLSWMLATLFGIWSTFLLFCAFIDIAGLLIVVLLCAGVNIADALSPSHWVHQALVCAFAASCAIGLLGLLQAARGPRIRKVRLGIAGLPAELEGMKIAQLSDLHIGKLIQKNHVARIVRKTLALRSDLIAITGDLADGTPADLREHTAPLAALTAPLGVYYATGNHEYYSGALAWIDEGRRLGFTPLINENKLLTYNGVGFKVAGVTDITAHYFLPEHKSDPIKAARCEKLSGFNLLLAHQPESAFEAQAAGFDLQLSGHTHGGQYFPFNILVRLSKKYPKGLHRHKNLWIYVNVGTGFWGPANRFFVPAEITLLELARR